MLRFTTYSKSFLTIFLWMLINTPLYALTNHYMPLTPRFSIQGNFGYFGFGNADLMVPVYGNTDRIFFLDAYTKIHNSFYWTGSLGGGYRTICCDHIFGAYLYGDQNIVDPGHYFVANPGLEFMSNEWDLHFNGYLVVDGDHKTTPKSGLFFANNNVYLNFYDLLQEAGSGGDAILGYTVQNEYRMRLFGGAYYYDFHRTRNIPGVVGGVELPVATPRIMVGIIDSYDRVQRNSFVLTLGFNLWGLSKCPKPDIHDRMVDPIPRHLGTIGYGSAIPTQEKKINQQFVLLP